MLCFCFLHLRQRIIKGWEAVHRRPFIRQSCSAIPTHFQTIEILSPKALIIFSDVVSLAKLLSLLLCSQIKQMLLEALAYGDHFWNINLGDLAVVDLLFSQALPFILIYNVIAVSLDLLPK